MVRLGFSLVVAGALGLLTASSAPATDNDSRLEASLALNAAMSRAEGYLNGDNSPKKAVEVLESNLSKVNGNSRYLRLLSDAYRAYIKELWLANQAALAQRYLDRLCILDPSAANDPNLRPAAETPAKVVAAPAPPVEVKQAVILPNFKANNPAKVEPAAAKPTAVRAKTDDSSVPPAPVALDGPGSKQKTQRGHQLLAQAEEEYEKKRYLAAFQLFEQAYQADPDCVAVAKERFAFCILSHVTEQVNSERLGGKNAAELQKEVERALKFAPKLALAGKQLVDAIGARGASGSARPPQVAAAVAAVALQHLGRNREGWQVTDTPHFRIFHQQDNDFGEKVARIAEQTRQEMGRKWFGKEAVWEPRCELIFHPSKDDYTKMTGVPGTSPGHSRIESDPGTQRVLSRRMDLHLDADDALEAVLPHETTHVVLAGQFGPFAVPRWADEGIAVLSEPAKKIEPHRKNLQRFNQDGLLFGLKELMELQEYPQPRRIGAFYAQSVVLVEFLAKQKGPQTVVDFVRDGLRSGYASALQRHYGMEFSELEQRWQQEVLGDANRVAARGGR